jgi:hypothetical protein
MDLESGRAAFPGAVQIVDLYRETLAQVEV